MGTNVTRKTEGWVCGCVGGEEGAVGGDWKGGEDISKKGEIGEGERGQGALFPSRRAS